jgi:hypothetical protein
MMKTSDTYRIRSLEVVPGPNNVDEDDTEQGIDVRSVLWPKICFKMFKDHYEHQHKRNIENLQLQEAGSTSYVSQRPTRKCYPFDMR